MVQGLTMNGDMKEFTIIQFTTVGANLAFMAIIEKILELICVQESNIHQ